jgi:hypothetical protein
LHFLLIFVFLVPFVLLILIFLVPFVLIFLFIVFFLACGSNASYLLDYPTPSSEFRREDAFIQWFPRLTTRLIY